MSMLLVLTFGPPAYALADYRHDERKDSGCCRASFDTVAGRDSSSSIGSF
jgi:hypothetical protein